MPAKMLNFSPTAIRRFSCFPLLFFYDRTRQASDNNNDNKNRKNKWATKEACENVGKPYIIHLANLIRKFKT